MRSGTASPIKRYHEVPLDDGQDHDIDSKNINPGVAVHTDLNDIDVENDGSNFHSAVSPSFGRMVGRSQYSRILASDESNNTTQLEQEEQLDLNNDETNSLVLADASSPQSRNMDETINRNSIFRESPASAQDGANTVSISRSASGVASTSGMNTSSLHQHRDEIVSIGRTGVLSRQGSRCASSTVSSVDWDDDEFDDDVVNIRRYHLEFGNSSLHQNQYRQQRGSHHPDNDHTPSNEFGWNVIIDCFRCRVRQSLSTVSFHWQSLRQAARQRRAARLLTMPSENVRYKVRSCFISWFCDATDIGIAFTALCVLLWILVGVVTQNASRNYWIIGISLFILRITARRIYDVCRSVVVSKINNRRQQRLEQRGRLGSRQHLSAVDFDHNRNSDMTIDPDNNNLPTHA